MPENPEVTIQQVDSSKMTLEDLVAARELIDKGYDYNGENDDVVDDNVLSEYGFDDKTSPYVRNWLARDPNGRVVASIGAKIMAAGGDDDGRMLWNALHTRAPELWRRAGEKGQGKADENRVAAHIWGAVVHPDARGQRLGTRLYQQLAADLQPPIIEGQTKTPAAVASRVGIPGYRHFYGTTEVTARPKVEGANGAEADQAPPPLPPEALAVFEAYELANERRASPDWGGWHIEADVLNSEVPNTDGFAPEIRAAFAGLQFEQTRMNRDGETGKTAVMPLISIRADLFDNMAPQTPAVTTPMGIDGGVSAPAVGPGVA